MVLVGHQKGRDIKERTRAELRDGLPRGVPEGDARDGARRPPRVPADHARRHAGCVPGGRGGAARARRRDRPLAGGHGRGSTCPTIAVVIGEGGSGGAVAIAVADRVLMQENAIYSVISPEGCAAILWRDASQARKAAAAFKPDAQHCLELGVVDAVVPEPAGGAHTDPDSPRRCSGCDSPPPGRPVGERRRPSGAAIGGRSSERWASSPARRRSPHFPQAYPPLSTTGILQAFRPVM